MRVAHRDGRAPGNHVAMRPAMVSFQHNAVGRGKAVPERRPLTVRANERLTIAQVQGRRAADVRGHAALHIRASMRFITPVFTGGTAALRALRTGWRSCSA